MGENKPQWGRFFSFFALVLCTLVLLNIGPKQTRTNSVNGWRYFYEELPENSVDIVFLGSSHAQCTFIPEIINAVLGVDSINLISPSETIHQTKLEYQEVLAYQNPSAVIIEPYVIYGGRGQDNLQPFQYGFFDSMPPSLKKTRYLVDFFSFNNLLNYYFPFLAEHTAWKTPGKSIKDAIGAWKGEETPIGFGGKGYYLLTAPLLPEDVETDSPAENPVCFTPDLDARLASVEAILKIDAQEPSSLFFIEAPTYTDRYQACRAQTSSLLAEYEKLYFTLLKNKAPSALWFHDETHMTQFGAVIASLETARLLSEELGFAINQDALAFYERYQFKDYSLERKGKDLQISLMPFNEALSKDLNYQWQVLKQGNSIYEEVVHGSSVFTFTLPDSSKPYLVKVTISSAAGAYGYELEGEFVVKGS